MGLKDLLALVSEYSESVIFWELLPNMHTLFVLKRSINNTKSMHVYLILLSVLSIEMLFGSEEGSSDQQMMPQISLLRICSMHVH